MLKILKIYSHDFLSKDLKMATLARFFLMSIFNSKSEPSELIRDINMDEENLFRKAIDIWGIKNQILTINEEQNELTIELCLYLEENNGKYALINDAGLKRIVEEIGDVLLVLNYGELIFDCVVEVKKIMTQFKIIKRVSKTRIIHKLILHMNRLSKRIHDFLRQRYVNDKIVLDIAKVKYWIAQFINFIGIKTQIKEQYKRTLKKLEKKVERALFTNKIFNGE